MCCTKFSKVSYHTNVPFTLSGSVILFLFANTRIGSSLQLVQSAEKAIWYHMFTHDAMYLQKLLFTINEHHDCSWMPSTVGAFFSFSFWSCPFFLFQYALVSQSFKFPSQAPHFSLLLLCFLPPSSSSSLPSLSSFAFLFLLLLGFSTLEFRFWFSSMFSFTCNAQCFFHVKPLKDGSSP